MGAVGAGNSVATLGLAGGLFARRLMDARGADAWLPAGALLLACIMAGLKDIHGVATLAGVIAGFAASGMFAKRV